VKSGLALADAFLGVPGRDGASAGRAALQHFSAEQIAELLLKLIVWSGNKTRVSLGFDGPLVAGQLTPFHYADDGAIVTSVALKTFGTDRGRATTG
jgi:hypothetical protein